MRGSRRVLLAAAIAVGLVPVFLPPGAGAQDQSARVVELGWWSDLPAPAPPDGGGKVGHGVVAPTSVTALVVDVVAGQPTQAELHLEETDGLGGDAAAVVVCPTDEDWQPAAGAPTSEAPTPDCDRAAIELTRSPEGAWTGDIAPLFVGSTASIMIVPATSEAPSTPFDIAFSRPTVTAAGTEPDVLAPVTTTTSLRPSTSGSASRPVFDLAPPAPIAAPAPLSPSTTVVPTAVDDGQVAFVPVGGPGPTAGGPRDWEKVIAYALVAAIAGVIAGVSRWQLRIRGVLGRA